MKTIVINTSKEAKRTKLDSLFRSPFGKEALLWYESDLSALGEVADCIKDDLINETEIVDKDYQLMVLVDVYLLPNGNEIYTARLYKALLSRYIGTVLVGKLTTEYNLRPLNTAVFFADSAKFAQDVDLSVLDSNALEQQRRLDEEQDARRKAASKTDENNDLIDAGTEVDVPKTRRYTFNDRRIMELFGWAEGQKKDELRFTLKLADDSDEALDFSDVFDGADEAIKYSHETANIVEIALSEVRAVADCHDTKWDAECRIELAALRNLSVRCLTHRFSRDNEQVWIEGFFNLFANIFMCVGSKTLAPTFTTFTTEEIKELLTRALKRYTYFSEERNIQVTFAPTVTSWFARDAIIDSYIVKAQQEAGVSDEAPAVAAERVLQKRHAMNAASDKNTDEAAYRAKAERLHGADATFYGLVSDVFANYDPANIKAQNAEVVRECLAALWKWRDKYDLVQLEDCVKQGDEAVIAANSEQNRPESTGRAMDPYTEREPLLHITEEYEDAKNEMICKITEAEHRLIGNKDILLETKELLLQYTDWMRKGKKRLIAFVGAIVSLVLTLAPFVCLQIFPVDNKLIPLAVALGLAAGACALYAAAAGYYMADCLRNKHALIRELKIQKEKSENDRKEAIIALYTYYTDTVLRAEGLRMLWNLILERDAHNARECVKRNHHLRRLTRLKKRVEDYCTMLKLDVDVDDVSDDVLKAKGLEVIAHEPFHSETNSKVYRVLDAETSADIPNREGETTV